MESKRKPLYKIIWRGKNVTQALDDYLLNLTYADHLHGKSDEVDITFEDRDDQWKDAWYPEKGDTVEVAIGLKEDGAEKWIKAGSFKIDEIDFSGPPDIVTVKGLSAYVTETQREKQTKAWENVNLSQVVSDLARKIGLEPYLEIAPDILLKRLDQKDTGDLAFVKTLADRYGYISKIDTERLIFRKPEALEKSGVVLAIERGESDLISYRFNDKTTETYKAAEVTYWDPVSKTQVKHTENAKGIVSGDVLKISERVENKQQAIERAKAELKRHNRLEKAGEIVYMGNPFLVAGANIALLGFYSLDGVYIIEEARHSISKSSGYTTSCQVRRVERHSEIAKLQAARKKKKRSRW